MGCAFVFHVVAALASAGSMFSATDAARARPPMLPPEPVAAAPAPIAPSLPDRDSWTRRNIGLIGDAFTNAAAKDQYARVEALSQSVGSCAFSIVMNPNLIDDAAIAQMRPWIEQARRETKDDESIASIDQLLAFMTLGVEERHLRVELFAFGAFDEDAGKPLEESSSVSTIGSTIAGVSAARYEKMVPELMERLARRLESAERWSEWVRLYADMAADAQRRDLPGRRDVYIDTLLTVLRAHPEFEHPERGNVNAVAPLALAGMLIDAKRDEQIPRLMDQLGDTTLKRQLAAGWVTALAERDRLDVAKEVVERTMTTIDPEAAAWLSAALDGRFIAPPKSIEDAKHRPLEKQPPGASEMIEAQNAIAGALAAAGGDVIAIGDAGLSGEVGFPLLRSTQALTSYHWAALGRRAGVGGNRVGAMKAFDRAIQALQTEPRNEPNQTAAKVAFVREALPLAGGYALAEQIFRFDSPVGAMETFQLAQLCAKAGQGNRSAALLNEALVVADKKSGGAMARIAVEIQKNGDRNRAESILLKAAGAINGEDFGISDTAAVVRASSQMNRLDLLERIYQEHKANRLLISALAARASDSTLFIHEGDQR